jgi:hypothetical protein
MFLRSARLHADGEGFKRAFNPFRVVRGRLLADLLDCP